ncbi:flavodoxin family protein [Thermoproteota archaeon]
MTNKNVLAIIGSYRKDGIIDQAVDEVLSVVKKSGVIAKKIYLTQTNIEFCTNCRVCTHGSEDDLRGKCIHNDDMEEILAKIDNADAIVLGSPINFGGVTAITKRFIERLVVYAYWPWEKSIPKKRIKKNAKKAVIITSSACPAFLGKIIMPCALQVMKTAANIIGAKVVKKVYLGLVCSSSNQRLNKKQLKIAELAGQLITK